MAPKKKEQATTEKIVQKALTIQEKLNKFLSDEKGIKSLNSEKPKLLRTGIKTLDAILGGGIIVGGIIQLVGRAGSGKSSLASKIMASFQKYSNGKALCLYIDTESTMTKYRLVQLGVNNPPISPITDCTLEDVIGIIESVIEFKKDNKSEMETPVIIVWDSIANTLSKKEMQAEDPKEVIGFKARLLSLYLPRITPSLPEYNITLICINQLRDSVGISMTPTPVAIKGMKQSDTIPGGRTLQFATSQLLYMTDVGNIEERTHGFDGKEVEIYCIKNKAFPPLIKTKTAFSYMGGYSNFWSSYSALKENKYIVAGGAWYSMQGYKDKFQGSKVVGLYTTNEEFKKTFDSLIDQHTMSIANKYTKQLESCNIDDAIESALSSDSSIREHILEEAKKRELLAKENMVTDASKIDSDESVVIKDEINIKDKVEIEVNDKTEVDDMLPPPPNIDDLKI